jgi:hypothetical protein
MFTAKLLEGTLFQDPSPICSQFLANAITLYTQPKHRPFLIIHLIHPETGEKVNDEELLSPDCIYYLLFDYHTVRPWVKEELSNFYNISSMPAAIRHLEKHKEHINYKQLSRNSAAGELLWEKRDDPECFDWVWLCKNPAPKVIPLMELHRTYVHWPSVCVNQNPDVLPFLEKYLMYVNWSSLSTNPIAIPLLLKYPQNIDWSAFSSNPASIPYLLEHPERINLHELCKNSNATDLLIERIDQFMPVDWLTISRSSNPRILEILELVPSDRFDLLDFVSLSVNPLTIEYVMKHDIIHESLFLYNKHPDILQYCKRVFGENFYTGNHLIFQNPYTIDYMEENLDWVIKSVKWYHLSMNPAIYCPPLD